VVTGFYSLSHCPAKPAAYQFVFAQIHHPFAHSGSPVSSGTADEGLADQGPGRVNSTQPFVTIEEGTSPVPCTAQDNVYHRAVNRNVSYPVEQKLQVFSGTQVLFQAFDIQPG